MRIYAHRCCCKTMQVCARILAYTVYVRCHQPMAALSLIVNINEKMDSKRLVEEVRTRPILYESITISYKNADKKAVAWKAVAAEMKVTGRCSFNIHSVNYNYPLYCTTSDRCRTLAIIITVLLPTVLYNERSMPNTGDYHYGFTTHCTVQRAIDAEHWRLSLRFSLCR